MNAREEKADARERSPIPNAMRMTYYDDRGEIYFTEWRLQEMTPPATARVITAAITDAGKEGRGELRLLRA